jgi:hypothetical protein
MRTYLFVILVSMTAFGLSGRNAFAQTNKLFRGCEGPYTNGAPPQQCSQPGFYAQQVEVMVSHIAARVARPDPSCNGNEGASAIDWSRALTDAARAYAGDTKALSRLSMNLQQFVKSQASQILARNIRGDVGAAIQRNFGEVSQFAACAAIAAVVPANAVVKAFRLGDWDNAVGVGGCAAGQDCANGWAKFDYAPVVANSGAMQTVTTNFKNWSADRDRVASMTVFYILPADSPPPLETW